MNSIALRKAKIVYNFGLLECNRVKINMVADFVSTQGAIFCLVVKVLGLRIQRIVFNMIEFHK